MAFGRQRARPPAATNDELDRPRPKRRGPTWLSVGVIALLVSTMDLIYIGGTGTSLIELESETRPDPTFHAIMSVILLIFGVVALLIHFSRRH